MEHLTPPFKDDCSTGDIVPFKKRKCSEHSTQYYHNTCPEITNLESKILSEMQSVSSAIDPCIPASLRFLIPVVYSTTSSEPVRSGYIDISHAKLTMTSLDIGVPSCISGYTTHKPTAPATSNKKAVDVREGSVLRKIKQLRENNPKDTLEKAVSGGNIMPITNEKKGERDFVCNMYLDKTPFMAINERTTSLPMLMAIYNYCEKAGYTLPDEMAVYTGRVPYDAQNYDEVHIKMSTVEDIAEGAIDLWIASVKSSIQLGGDEISATNVKSRFQQSKDRYETTVSLWETVRNMIGAKFGIGVPVVLDSRCLVIVKRLLERLLCGFMCDIMHLEDEAVITMYNDIIHAQPMAMLVDSKGFDSPDYVQVSIEDEQWIRWLHNYENDTLEEDDLLGNMSDDEEKSIAQDENDKRVKAFKTTMKSTVASEIGIVEKHEIANNEQNLIMSKMRVDSTSEFIRTRMPSTKAELNVKSVDMGSFYATPSTSLSDSKLEGTHVFVVEPKGFKDMYM